jgi:anti-sigma factor RsiW
MSHGPHDITCRELVELVTDFLEGTLSADDRERLEAHLEACDPCVEYVDQIRATVALLGRLSGGRYSPPAESGSA